MNKFILGLALLVMSAASAQPGKPEDSQGLAARVAELEAQVELLLSLADNAGILDSFSKSGSDIYLNNVNLHLVGGNLHVVNGLEDTATANGLGNVIIGYNEDRDSTHTSPINDRSGSHMLVVGARQNYNSYGGILSGSSNSAAAPFSSLIGGYYNETSGNYSSILGGVQNLTSGTASAMVGGQSNEATGFGSTATGGWENVSAGAKTSVNGGARNLASGPNSSVNGGFENSALGQMSSILGGHGNVTTFLAGHPYAIKALFDTISGGTGNEASGGGTSILGGDFNSAAGPASTILGGQNQTTVSAFEIKP